VELASILVAAAILIPAAAYIARPLIIDRFSENGQLNSQGSRLYAEKDRILNAIQELDMDHAMGKVPEQHYQIRREALVADGIQTLKELDEIPTATEDPIDHLELEIQQAAAQLRGASAAEFCPQCGTKAAAGDLFCTSCGNDLSTAEGRD
jgi:hypothetical protein